MALSCACYDDGDYAWYYTEPDDFSKFDRKRRCRCVSCKKLIEVGAVCLEFTRWRHPNDDIEAKIHGEDYGAEVPLAHWFMCEACGDIYYNLTELGFCITLGDNMNELLEEYRIDYGSKKDPCNTAMPAKEGE